MQVCIVFNNFSIFFPDSSDSEMDQSLKTILYVVAPIFFLCIIVGGIIYACRYLHKRRMASLMGQNDLEHFYHDDLRGSVAGDSTLKVIF